MTMVQAEELLHPGRMLVGDEFLAEGSGGEYIHHNPSTGRPHPPIPLAGAAEVDRAVAAARSAYPVWQAMPRDARRDAMLRLAGLIRDHIDEFATLVTLENGSPRRNSSSGPQMAVDNFTYFAGWVDKVGGDVIPTWPAPALDYTLMEPYGVVGVIIPWNAVMHNIGQVIGAALAAGNCVVLKAPELAPFAAIRFGELARESGLPPGVVNVLPGGAECGKAMVAHAGVDKIHFIGSGNTARQIMASAAQTMKPVTFELGGKSANVVFADADLQSAAVYATFLSMANAGQGCLLPTRLLVEDGVYEEVIETVVGFTRSIQIGDPFDQATMLGPVINGAACERILGVIEQARSDGSGRLLTGGGRAGGDLAAGYFVEPTVFGDVDNASDLAQKEIFGPVLSVIRFRDEAEAIALANATQYGLAAYVHTNDLRRAHRVAAALEAGSVYVNAFTGVPAGAPFGGVKQSGFGRMGGRYGLEDFLHPKNVYIPLG
ncbi:betaine-aldehyde dehydrogenase [Mycobacterium mantenii]|uniref:Putative succinate-semialdehyde dehydrogenase [NADP(+)] 2 n=3 Tax=Mycobacterium mantenii TaxID=560555 RepID=A0A1X0F7S2_MYCNT|nr:aldehyde dehydrogenase [Mycobacterium mantenii]BBY37986.1 betaine-aldehyde dehydrogenase [Mycobacterium mantenii]